MKKFIAGVVLGFVMTCAVGFAAPGFDHNGVFWNKLSNPAKTGYIKGYSDAIRVSVSKLDSLTIAADLFHWKGADKIIHQLSHELSMAELRPNDAVRKLDTLYSNSKYSVKPISGRHCNFSPARVPEYSNVPADSSIKSTIRK